MSWCALRYGSCALIRIVPQSTFSLCYCLLIVSDTLSVVKNRSHVKIRCKTLKLIQMFMNVCRCQNLQHAVGKSGKPNVFYGVHPFILMHGMSCPGFLPNFVFPLNRFLFRVHL